MLAELAREISWPSLLHALSGVVENIVFSSFSEIPGRRGNWHADHRRGQE
jgi:hypothetical protein